jgi:dTDP-glucose 4,6-dehydratase/UDP-glucose 4-epimerase
MKKLLIIGSTGFIGKNAVSYFIDKGYEVFCADIVIKEEKNYFVLNPESSDFSFLFLQQKYDVCINASGAASVPLSFQYPAIDFSLNVLNVFNILEAIRKYNPKCKFINFSSAAVYGNPETLPVKENSAINPLSPYGFHKHYSENICKEFYQSYHIQTLSLRVFSAYGEGLKKQLFWDIYKKLQNATDNQVVLYGTGNESRDFIYIRDLLKAIELLIQKHEFKGQAINVASGIEVTIKEAAEIFIKNLNPEIKLTFNNQTKQGDPKNWKADTSVLNAIGFKCDYKLNVGLENYAKWVSKKV